MMGVIVTIGTKLFRNGMALAVATFATLQAEAAILSVCQSGCQYSLPSQAYNAAAAGDTIQIQPGTYTDCIYIQKSNLTITGINGMPKMVNKVCGQKGILVTAAQNLTIRNLELSGSSNGDNYAGIRHDAAGFNLTLDNVYIHDNDDGLLGSSSGDTITITNSRFSNNGMNNPNGMAHNIYVGNAANFIFSNSSSTAPKLKGHVLKSRSARLEVQNSTLATLGGQDSRLIDYSNGGTLIVQNSVLEKSPTSDNNEMIAFGPEGLGGGRAYAVTLTGNKVIGDRTPTDLIAFFNGANSINISSNVLVNIRNITNSGTPSGNTVYSSRSAAGYAAYPSLPSPGSTTTQPPATTTTTTLPPAPPSSDWTRCASEGGTCSFTGTRQVRYGANGVYKTVTATGSVGCNNNAFGGDPVVGVAKTCDYSNSTTTVTTLPPPPPASGWTRCASEGGTCSFTGTRQVRYGANGVYKTVTATGSVGCNNNAFGGDPVYGTAKTCDYSNTVVATETWANCASEGGSCAVAGTRQVRYGANGSYITKTVTGSIACDNNAFGGDPIYGTAKTCQYSSIQLASASALSTESLVASLNVQDQKATVATAADSFGHVLKATRRDSEATDLFASMI
jgi:hypothetical protein